jgi:carboxyl-terminal processing protease
VFVKKSVPRFLVVDMIVLALVLGLFLGILIDRRIFFAFSPPDNVPEDAASSFRLMAETWNIISGSYVDRTSLSNDKLAYGAIGGMVDSLGDKGHSRFMTPDQVRQMRGVIKGRFVGIGIELQMTNGQPTVVAPLDGSPAGEAGVWPGDVILRVNERDTKGLGLEEIVKLVQGPVGSSVEIKIKTPATGVTRGLTLKRRSIAIHNVTWQRIPGTTITHVRIASFSKGSADDLKKVLDAAADKSDNGVTSVILDLRNNPGGLLEEAVAVTSQFQSEGIVVKVKKADGTTEELKAEPGGVALTVPLIVLINGGTASAAEIVAGALQDGRRATIVGETTVGTGTVLRQFPLEDGSALLLATYEWLTPAGRLIWHKGIDPDVRIDLPPDRKPIYPVNERTMAASDLHSTGDSQLLEAIRLAEKAKHTKIPRKNAHRDPTMWISTYAFGIGMTRPPDGKIATVALG